MIIVVGTAGHLYPTITQQIFYLSTTDQINGHIHTMTSADKLLINNQIQRNDQHIQTCSDVR